MTNSKRVNRLIIFFLFITLLLNVFSCTFFDKEIHPFTMVYTNTPYANKNYMGKIAIKLDLDTIELKENDERVTLLYLGKFKNQHNISDLEKMHTKLDTFGFMKDNDDTIYFDYKFKNTGNYFLDGYIEDLVLLRDYYPNGKARMISKLIKVSEKVKVIDK